MRDNDDSERLHDAIKQAYAQKLPVYLGGSGSKHFLGASAGGSILSLIENQGVVQYRPEELVLTARAGTSLDEIESLLAVNNQFLPFDPPRFGGQGTLGGALACGLAGPGRVWWGSARDSILGVEIVNGMGQRLKFGGEVLKNVAGYDISRLISGSFGTLGLILNASVRLLPKSALTQTRMLQLERDEALKVVVQLARSAAPITASCHVGESLYVRMSGSEMSLKQHGRQLGGEQLGKGQDLWQAIRDHKHNFFRQETNWRISLPPASPYPDIGGEWMTEWAGAQRWLSADLVRKKDVQNLHEQVRKLGGHVACYAKNRLLSNASSEHSQDHATKPSAQIMKYHKALKNAFDPAGILNPQRMFAEF